MLVTLKRLLKLTAGYSVVSILGPLVAIFLTPLYTRRLEPADYGVVDVALTIAYLLGTLSMLGMDTALSAHFFDGDTLHQQRLVKTAYLTTGVLASLLALPLWVFAPYWATWLFDDPHRSYVFYLVGLNIYGTTWNGLAIITLRLRMGIKRYNALGLWLLLATAANNIVLILILGLKATGAVAANTLAVLSTAGIGLWLVREYFHGDFSFDLSKKLVITGVGLMPGALGGILLNNADRLMLTQYVSQTDLGLYAIANKLASFAGILATAALSALWPIMYEMAAKPEAPRQFARLFEYYLSAILGLSLGIGLFAPELLTIFTRALYLPAAPMVLSLVIYTGPLTFMTSFFCVGLTVTKRTHHISAAFLLAAGVNVALNLWLNPMWGVWGAVWATVSAGLIWVALTYYLGQRAFPIQYRWLRQTTLFSVYLVLVGTFLLVPQLQNIPAKLGGLAVFGAASLAVGVVSPAEINWAVTQVQQRLRQALFSS